MKKYSTVLFDLDGTIIDNGEGVANSVVHALTKLGINVENKAMLSRFIGPPLIYSFKTFCHLDEEKAKLAIDYYREHYNDKGIFEGYVYDGIKELLKELSEAGIKVVLATSKPEEFAKRILEKADILKYFDFIAGATMDETSRVTKIDVLEYALKEANIDTPSDVIMVGDRFYDIEGAHHFGIACIAVLYGYGSKEEFEKYGAEYIVNTPDEISKMLLGK